MITRAEVTSETFALGYGHALGDVAMPESGPLHDNPEYTGGYAAGWMARHGGHVGRIIETRVTDGVAKRRYFCRRCDSEFRA